MNFLNLCAYRRHILYLFFFLSLPDILFLLSFVFSSLCQVYCYDSKILGCRRSHAKLFITVFSGTLILITYDTLLLFLW